MAIERTTVIILSFTTFLIMAIPIMIITASIITVIIITITI